MIEQKASRHRRSVRLREYDYGQEGAYFVTICTKDRALMFGEIIEEKMKENQYGKVVRSCWNELPSHYRNVLLDEFVIMPNHVHGVVKIIYGVTDDHVGAGLVGAGLRPAPTHTPTSMNQHGLPEIIRAFKSFSARRINKIRNTPGVSV
jgi:putative transposase